MTATRTHRTMVVLCWFVIAVSVAAYALIAFLPQSRETYRPAVPDKYKIESLTLVQPDVLRFIACAGLIGFFTLLLLAAINLYRRRYSLYVLLSFSAVLGPISVVASFIRDPAPWAIHNEIRSTDGTTYGFAGSSFLQGQRLLLVRVREETRWTRTFDALVLTAGDSPRRYLRIVRPAGAENTYGQLYLTDDGWLLGLRNENRCYFAYDTRSGQPYAHGAVEALSPFLALDATAELHEPDVADLAANLGQNVVETPSAEAIRKGLDHPNPRVRAVAAGLLKKMR